MFNCPNCNQTLEDGSAFCSNCGTKFEQAEPAQPVVEQPETVQPEPTQEENSFCPNCGTKITEGAVFCPNCGISFVTSDEPATETKQNPFSFADIWSKVIGFLASIPKKIYIFGGAALALILVAVILVLIFFTGGPANYGLYIKDGEMIYADASSFKPWRVTTDLVQGSFSSEKYNNLASNLGLYVQLSKDGEKIFYFDELDQGENGGTLYCRYVNDSKTPPLKIDTDVTMFFINEDADRITYIKGNDETLYQHNLKDKSKIDSDIGFWAVSLDGETLVYETTDGDNNLYYHKLSEERVKIASDIGSIEFVSDDLKTIYFTESYTIEATDTTPETTANTLYKFVLGSEKQKIASDLYSVEVFESGEIYYTVSETKTIKIADYVNDDLKDSDAKMTQPVAPTYPYSWNYNTVEEYNAAYNKYNEDYNKYYENLDKYYEKLSRDEIREELKDMSFTHTTQTVFYFDGEDATQIASNVDSINMNANTKAAITYYSYKDAGNIEKVKIADIDSVYGLEEKVNNAFNSDRILNLAVKNNVKVLEETDELDISDTYFDADTNNLYYLATKIEKAEVVENATDSITESETKGTLMIIDIADGTIKDAATYDEDVNDYYLESDGSVIYFKDVKNDKGDLYMNKTKIDSDVYTRTRYLTYDEKNGNFIYMIDWNDEKEYGTLKIFDGSKSTVIADDVNCYSVTAEGEVFCMADYNINRGKGDLVLFDGKSQKVDGDISGIIPIYTYPEDMAYYSYY